MPPPYAEPPPPAKTRRNRARSLRNNATDAEQELWWHLRRRIPLKGTHFRRQVSIGPYFADFACLNPRIVIELDGSQHALDKSARYDANRDAAIKAQGFRILRFWNHEIFDEIESVLDTIFAAMNSETPNPYPSPQGGGAMAPLARDSDESRAAERPPASLLSSAISPVVPPPCGKGHGVGVIITAEMQAER